MRNIKGRVLFLSYDGMTDALGRSQVLSYLSGLSAYGHDIHLISYEKPDAYQRDGEEVGRITKASGITWHPLPYTKKPPVISTIIDLTKGWSKIISLQKEEKFDIVHCRGYITSLLGKKMKKKWGTRFIFDMRGWWADEKKESGNWASILYFPVYKYFKKQEKIFFQFADVPVSLTYAGQKEAERLGYRKKEDIRVIPTCVNFEIFKDFDEEIRYAVRKELGIPKDAYVFVYSGSLGGNYGSDKLLLLYKIIQQFRKNAVLLILSKTDKSSALQIIESAELTTESVFLHAASYTEVGRFLMAGDAGIVMYEQSYSVIGRSPTKLGEYWASGLMSLGLKGVGDLDFLSQKYPSSLYVIPSHQEQKDIEGLLQWLDIKSSPYQLRKAAIEYFDLQKGIDFYHQLYCDLLIK